MKFGPLFVTDRCGQKIELRSAALSDSDALIAFLKTTSGETPYLIREPDEVQVTPEQERAFLQNKIDAERSSAPCLCRREAHRQLFADEHGRLPPLCAPVYGCDRAVSGLLRPGHRAADAGNRPASCERDRL